MRVLHVLAPAAVGGLETVVAALTTGHRAQGLDARVLAIFDPGASQAPHPFRDGLRAASVPLEAIEVPARGYAAERRALAAALERERPDIVHTHGYRADVVDAPVARRMGIPVVTTVHGFTGGSLRNRLYEMLQVRAFRRVAAVVAVSRPLAALLERRGVPAATLRTIPNAWRAGEPPLPRALARERLGLPESGTLLGWVGRLTREKGADVLLAALPRLADVPFQVAFVGDGRERAALQQQAHHLGVAGRVRWLTGVSGAAPLLGAFDRLIMSSRTEGTPMVLFEAIAAGTPVIASRVGGIPDVVSDQEAALVPPDNPEALAAAVRQSLSDPAGAAARAGHARERLARDFAAAPWLSAYRELYRELAPGAAC